MSNSALSSILPFSVSLLHEPARHLDAINVAKVVTGVVIFFLGGTYGYSPRSTIYTGLHVSYLAWWMLEQALFPPFAEKRFAKECTPSDWVLLLLLIGVGYALPAWNAFRNPSPNPGTMVVIASIACFSIGCLVNTMADVQMHTTKALQPPGTLVTEGIFRLCQNPNWLGDYLRYGSFCLISGKFSSSTLLAIVMLLNYGSTQDPSAKGGMMDRYGEAYSLWIEKVPNKLWPRLEANTCWIILGIVLVWMASFASGAFLAGARFRTTSTNHNNKSKAL